MAHPLLPYEMMIIVKVYITLRHFCYLKVLRISCTLKCSRTRSKIFSPKIKGFRDDLSYSTPQKSKETRENAITQPWFHPIPQSYIFIMGCMGPRLGNSICFEGVSVTDSP